MEINKKSYSVALISAALILFLIFVSSTASAQAEPEITSGVEDTSEVEDTSDEQVISDEVPAEFDGIATDSVQPAALKITEKRITTNASGQQNPVIYGDRIVWEDDRNGNWDIYMYNLSTSTETQITTNKSNQTYLAIDGNRIVWADDRKGNLGDIYMYDLSTKKETRITTSGNSSNPDIYGNKIVYQYSGIWLYDLSTKKVTQIAKDWFEDDEWGGTEHDNYCPVIYGNKIVWEVSDYTRDMGGSYGIYLYDLSTKKTTSILSINDMDGLLGVPHIYNGRIVYTYDTYEKIGIYMYDLSTQKETQITPSISSYNPPAIYKDKIVYDDYRDGDTDIYMYDLYTKKEAQITTDKSDQSYPNIYGDRIVWTDMRNGNADIYMGVLSSTSPVAAFSASPTSGKAPLNVAFKDKSTGKPTSWKWTFGDGTTSTKQKPTHKYSKAGKYTVSLTVKNAAGSNTVTKKDYIKVATKPVAAFSAKPTSGKAPLKVQFTDKSTGSPTSWKWSFGDGKTSTSKSPAYTYKKAGKYTVKLTVKNGAGSSTKTMTNYITVK